MLNIFSLHGKYFRDDENRLTANVLFLLSENRSTFLQAFLRVLEINVSLKELSDAQLEFQPQATTRSGRIIPDAEIRIGDRVHVLLEAKIGQAGLRTKQVRAYAEYLAASPARVRRLVCVTQIDDGENFDQIVNLAAGTLPKSAYRYVRWFNVIRLARESIGLDATAEAKLDRLIARGKAVSYSQRITSLFLRELEKTMYDRIVIDEIPLGEMREVTVTTQDSLFMDVALNKQVWFPSGQTKHGLKPSAYVAYYQTGDKENRHPKHITHVARNRIYWNRISLSDARQIGELKHLFRDGAVNKEISTWRKENQTFHLALTDKPIKLRRPIPYGRRNVGRVLSKRKCDLADLMNAQTVDDLFG